MTNSKPTADEMMHINLRQLKSTLEAMRHIANTNPGYESMLPHLEVMTVRERLVDGMFKQRKKKHVHNEECTSTTCSLDR
jgi:hypothetical protein